MCAAKAEEYYKARAKERQGTRTDLDANIVANCPQGSNGKARNRRIFDLWLACWTDAEIGEDVGRTHQAVNLVLQESASPP